MKTFWFTILMMLFFAGIPIEGLAANTFDASAECTVSVSAVSETDISPELARETADTNSETLCLRNLFTRPIRDLAASTLSGDLGFRPIHGQPLPGVLITLLLGAAFGLARRKRTLRHSAKEETNAATVMLITARLFRLNILFLNPPESIHTISPGPDLFCLRE